VSKLSPGTALELLNGSYPAETIDCTGPAGNGTMMQPIVLAAANERQAQLRSNGGSAALSLVECSNWVIEGLTAIEGDSASGANAAQSTVDVAGGGSLEFRRLLIQGNNRYFATTCALQIANTAVARVVDTEIYDYSTAGLCLNSVSGPVEIQRLYTNSRGRADIGGGQPSIDPVQGDVGIAVFSPASGSTLLENCVSEGAQLGFEFADANESSSATATIFGSLALGSLTPPYMAIGLVSNTNSYDVDVQDFAGVNTAQQGAWFQAGESPLVSNMTFLDTQGVTLGKSAGGTVQNTQSSHGNPGWGDSGTGFWTGFVAPPVDASAWTVAYSNAVGNPTADYAPQIDSGEFHDCKEIPLSQTIGTGPGDQCFVYVPDGSSMHGIGMGGADIGANVVYRVEDGGLTATKLWTPAGTLPCGALVTGINDVTAGPRCLDLYERLNFVDGGCPIP
jgi:hypothetical protein